jgi:hypothetical protein
MDTILETIRAAIEPNATAEARVAGAAACRMMLAALEGTPGEPMAAAVPATPSPIASIVGALRGVPPEQLLDLAIAKLRAALPADTTVPRVEPLKFHIIPMPTLGGAR